MENEIENGGLKLLKALVRFRFEIQCNLDGDEIVMIVMMNSFRKKVDRQKCVNHLSANPTK